MTEQELSHTTEDKLVTNWQEEIHKGRVRIAVQVLPIVIGAAAVLNVLYAGVYAGLDKPWQWGVTVGGTILTTVILIIAFMVVNKGHLETTLYLVTLAVNVQVLVGPALVEGLVIPGILIGMLAIMFARLIADREQNRIVMSLTGICLAASIIMAQVQVFDMLAPPPLLKIIIGLFWVAVTLFVTAMILDLRDDRLEDSLRQAQEYAVELNANQAALEERTHDLERRTRYLEANAEVARDTVAVLDVQELLDRVVRLISRRFNFYHTGIFLLDSMREWANLQAASSAGGLRMLSRGHRLRVGEEGIVGYVAESGEPRIALDVGADAVFFDNPDLPETRSEIALPLRARGQILGVLDVQSAQAQAFSEEDTTILQVLADQIAMAISNARLFEQVQESLEAERRAYSQLSGEAWKEMLRTRPERGYRYSHGTVVPVDGDPREKASLLDTQVGMPRKDRAASDALPEVSIPLRVRGQVIGHMKAHKPADAGQWAPEERELLEDLTEQLTLTLESARLQQETQRQALREQLIGQVTARMRETLSIEAVLQTAAEETRRNLDLPEVVIQLRTDEDGRHSVPGSEPDTGGESDQ
jgi:GAF domain-containing protein